MVQHPTHQTTPPFPHTRTREEADALAKAREDEHEAYQNAVDTAALWEAERHRPGATYESIGEKWNDYSAASEEWGRTLRALRDLGVDIERENLS